MFTKQNQTVTTLEMTFVDSKVRLLDILNEPTVINNAINDWELLNWDLSKWTEKLGDKLLPFRVGLQKYTKNPQWEGDCKLKYITMKEFVNICESAVTRTEWLYFDYKYMHEWFADNSEIIDGVHWGAFGFPERRGTDSTIWMGSPGAHTPCHMDSYGCNFVAQIFGRKQWILFPPDKTEVMKPVRVPYEESSVFSLHNFFSPDLVSQYDLKDARVVTLTPGQVLFVPRHWWHYVENVDTAISINTWIPLESDDTSRVDEALVRFYMTLICRSVPSCKSLLNPNEKDLILASVEESLSLLDIAVKKCEEYKNSENLKGLKVDLRNIFVLPTYSDTDFLNFLTEKRKRNTDEATFPTTSSTTVSNKEPAADGNQPSVKEPDSILISVRSETQSAVKQTSEDCSVLLEDCINAFCHPSVLTLVRQIIQSNKVTNESKDVK